MAPSIFDLTNGEIPKITDRFVLSNKGAARLKDEYLDGTSARYGYDIRHGDIVEVLGVEREVITDKTETRVIITLPLRLSTGQARIGLMDDLFSRTTTEYPTPGRRK